MTFIRMINKHYRATILITYLRISRMIRNQSFIYLVRFSYLLYILIYLLIFIKLYVNHTLNKYNHKMYLILINF